LEYLKRAKAHGVKRFIYASSVAVYGTSDKYMTEDMDLRPSTIYGTGKEYAEALVFAYNTSDFATVRVRAASVCGQSPNVRFDITLNKMVHDAVHLGVIKVNGGNQYRCHVSIRDLCDFYRLLLTAPIEKISGQAFNVVKENQTVMESAKMVSYLTGAKIETFPSSDNRSYKVDGSKAMDVLGFTAKQDLLVPLSDLKVRIEAGYWPYSMVDPSYLRLISARW
jgi:nucleoside-diphosphate-sugar epimerase